MGKYFKFRTKSYDVSSESRKTESSQSEQQSEAHTPWRSVIIMGLCGMCTSIQYSAYITSMWPYLKLRDPNVDEVFFGQAAASYPLAQGLMAPVFGWWSNRIKNVKLPIMVAVAIECVGNFVYFCIQLAPGNASKWMFAVNRVICGVGTSNVSLMKSYACTASTVADRTAAIATVMGLFAFGLVLGPLLQLATTAIGETGWAITDYLALNMYTVPALLACTVNVLTLVMLQLFFVEDYSGLDSGAEATDDTLPPPNKIGLAMCFVANFAQMFMWGTIETLGAPIAMTLFALRRTEAVMVVAVAHGVKSAFDLGMNAAFAILRIGRFINQRIACLVGFVGMGLFYVITFPYPFVPGTIKTYSAQEKEAYLRGNASEPAGCDVTDLHWCAYTHPVNFYLYYASYIVIIGCAFALVSITMFAVFSQVVGPRRQGTHQGFMQAIGSAGRMAGPSSISFLYQHYGIYQAWGLDMSVMFVTALFWGILYKKLAPMRT